MYYRNTLFAIGITRASEIMSCEQYKIFFFTSKSYWTHKCKDKYYFLLNDKKIFLIHRPMETLKKKVSDFSQPIICITIPRKFFEGDYSTTTQYWYQMRG